MAKLQLFCCLIKLTKSMHRSYTQLINNYIMSLTTAKCIVMLYYINTTYSDYQPYELLQNGNEHQ